MDSREGSDHGDDQIQQEKIVRGFVRRGQPFVQDADALEAVTLAATPSRLLFLQQPRRFQKDTNARSEKLVQDVEKANLAYSTQCTYNREHLNQTDVDVQTVQETMFHKACNTAQLTSVNVSIDANFLDIVQQNPESANLNTTQVQNEEHTTKKESSQHGDTDFDDEASIYTGKDDAVSEAGTAYTTGTHKTATKSINSIGSSMHEQDKLQLERAQTQANKLYQNKQFIQDLLLVEMLALQQPFYQHLNLFRASDVVLDQNIDYQQQLRKEFTAGNEVQQNLKVQELFVFKSDKLNNCKAIAIDFSLTDERLIVVGYSSNRYGAIAVWQPENQYSPKTLVYTRNEITCVKWFPVGKSIVGVGFADGSVCIFDLREQYLQFDNQGFVIPVLISNNNTGKHTSRVWDIQWVAGDVGVMQADQEGPQTSQNYDWDTLISVATDGRVVERSLKRNFEHRDILTLTNLAPHPVALVQNQKNSRMTIIRKLSAGLSVDFLDSTNYLVSGDDALIRKASRSYSEQTLMQYSGHLSSVYKVRVNQSVPKFFLSASADRTCKVWDVENPAALVTLKTPSQEHIYAAEWCPFKASVIVSGNRDGTIDVWDLARTTNDPQVIIPKLKTKISEDEEEVIEENKPVRCIAFNQKLPTFGVGYENGWVVVFRLFGVENGYLLKSMDQQAFVQVESEMMKAVLSQEGK
ncbi:Dynein_intermediate chain [Hexamita inflata]|uniref:Dynein axonemal intermediate chain 4 n=2 Tax=Hexamita inflata TaxID=28002 RepID=A0AA86PEX2_9EUKA|nr:Dynein intermediate chain [Hexamita inflata]CAI9961581.1 Dynein intermediate chain [Hexamita inflata]